MAKGWNCDICGKDAKYQWMAPEHGKLVCYDCYQIIAISKPSGAPPVKLIESCEWCGKPASFTSTKNEKLCTDCFNMVYGHPLPSGDAEIEAASSKWEEFFGVTENRQKRAQARVDLVQQELRIREGLRRLEAHSQMMKAYQEAVAGG